MSEVSKWTAEQAKWVGFGTLLEWKRFCSEHRALVKGLALRVKPLFDRVVELRESVEDQICETTSEIACCARAFFAENKFNVARFCEEGRETRKRARIEGANDSVLKGVRTGNVAPRPTMGNALWCPPTPSTTTTEPTSSTTAEYDVSTTERDEPAPP